MNSMPSPAAPATSRIHHLLVISVVTINSDSDDAEVNPYYWTDVVPGLTCLTLDPRMLQPP